MVHGQKADNLDGGRGGIAKGDVYIGGCLLLIPSPKIFKILSANYLHTPVTIPAPPIDAEIKGFQTPLMNSLTSIICN